MQNLTASGQRYHIEFTNLSGSVVPAFGVIQVVGILPGQGDNRPVAAVIQPNQYGSQTMHYVNGPVAVQPWQNGYCADPAEGALQVAASTTAITGSSASLNPGDYWGPTEGSWQLSQYVGGFRLVGQNPGGNLVFEQAPFTACQGKTFYNLAPAGSSSYQSGSGQGNQGGEGDNGAMLPWTDSFDIWVQNGLTDTGETLGTIVYNYTTSVITAGTLCQAFLFEFSDGTQGNAQNGQGVWGIMGPVGQPIIRGTINDTLRIGGHVTLTDLNGNQYQAYEALGINGYTYKSGTNLDITYNAQANSGQGQWEVLQPVPQVARMTLTADLSSGYSATARATNGTSYTVYEVQGIGQNVIKSGSVVICYYNNDLGQWEVISAGCSS